MNLTLYTSNSSFVLEITHKSIQWGKLVFFGLEEI
jgi:hypothetical protein